ncbi:MAG: hypothetical protein JO069_03550 [Verrucomicrobia bacterium]|nr:hypothetical protein [Verrucomicrobiota bacterium]
MRRARKTTKARAFPHGLTKWGVTLVVMVALFAAMSAAYSLMVGEYSVPEAAKKAGRSTYVEGRRTPPPARGEAS